MRFSHNVAKEIFDRSALKLAVICLSVISIMFAIFLALDVSKDPIVIERACETKLLDVGSSAQTNEEVQAFVNEAIPLRFDTKPKREAGSFMIQDLLAARTKEQDELKKSGIDQRVFVRSAKIEGDHFLVDADRIVAVGKVRSAIPTTLMVKVLSKNRSLTNPYGLVLTSVEPKPEEKKQ